MADFFQRAGAVSPRDHHSAFDLVAKGRAALQVAQSKAQFDIRNLESVFAAFEMAELLVDEFGPLTQNDVQGLGTAIRRVIVTTIEESMRLRETAGKVMGPRDYVAFGALLKHLRVFNEVSVVTFNYDIGIELGLLCNDLEPYYAIEGPMTQENQVAVLKLHGSLNWARCGRCERLIVQRVWNVVHDKETAWRRDGRLAEAAGTALHPSDSLRRLTCVGACESAQVSPDPVIVPPTAYKMDSHRALRSMWREAAKALREADEVHVLGYSWPPSDHFFHQLYAVGSIGSTLLSRFWVWNPDPSVRLRFRDNLLGQQARDCFGPVEALTDSEHRFRNAVPKIAAEYGVTLPPPGADVPVLSEHRKKR